MNVWLTVHWPPFEDEPADTIELGVWICDGRETAGADLTKGDFVFIYDTKTGKTVIETDANGKIRHHRRQIGREGVVAIAKAMDSIRAQPDSPWDHYTDGTKRWWRWYAPLELLSTSGFVPRSEVLKALGYKSKYNLRGFGDNQSGLKKLTVDQFKKLRDTFASSVKFKSLDANLPLAGHPGEGGGESQAHLILKKYVAANPSIVLHEPLVTTIEVERPFPTGDRADIVLRDQFDPGRRSTSMQSV